jgi:hypothetical protein
MRDVVAGWISSEAQNKPAEPLAAWGYSISSSQIQTVWPEQVGEKILKCVGVDERACK